MAMPTSPGRAPSLSAVERQVLDVLRRHGALPRSELAQVCQLPRSTLMDVTARLRLHGLVIEQPRAADPARRGRPAMVVRLAPPAGHVAVISLTHGTLRAAVIGFDGQVHGERVAESGIDALADGPVPPGLNMIDEILADCHLARGGLACAVIGVPMPFQPGVGVIDLESPSSAARPTALPDWTRSDPAPRLAAELSVPAWCENDANLGALGEHAFGAAQGLSELIYIKIAEGVGSGIIVNGRLCRGARGLAGEMLHLHVSDEGPVCICGGRGCLLTHFNTPRLVDIVQPAHRDPITVSTVFALASGGDAGASRVLADMGRLLGRSLADLCVLLNLEAIVIDGLLGEAASAVIAGIRLELDRYAPPGVVADARLVRGLLGRRAELLGAVALARQKLALPAVAAPC